MKSISEMSLGELAAFICSHLKKNGIHAVLSGGACVSIYTENKYQSYDLDFIENMSVKRNTLRSVLKEIGFPEENRYFVHPDTEFFIEFPPGPLSVGDEPVDSTVPDHIHPCHINHYHKGIQIVGRGDDKDGSPATKANRYQQMRQVAHPPAAIS